MQLVCCHGNMVTAVPLMKVLTLETSYKNKHLLIKKTNSTMLKITQHCISATETLLQKQ